MNQNSLQNNKMFFIFNAIENGWSVHKRQNLYVFTKKHENKKELYLDNYLKKFIKENLGKCAFS